MSSNSGEIERVADGNEVGHRRPQARGTFAGGFRQRQADGFAQIEREGLEGAGIGQHRGAASRQGRAAQREVEDIGELLKTGREQHPGVLDLRTHDFEVAGHGAGVRGGRSPGGLGTARMEQDDPLAGGPRPAGGGEETAGLAELLHDQRDDPGGGIVHKVLGEVLHAGRRLVAGRDRERKAEAAGEQVDLQHRGHGTALRDDADAGPVAEFLGRHLYEGERHAVNEVDEAEAVRPLQDKTMFPGEAGELALLGEARLASLGEAGREDDDRADLARGELPGGLEHRGARDGQHRDVDARGKFTDRAAAFAPADLGALGVDEMDFSPVTGAFQIGEHRGAEGARGGRGPDDGNRAGPEQAVERRGGVRGVGHDSRPKQTGGKAGGRQA